MTPPSTSRRPLARRHRRVDAGDREARVDRLRRRAGAEDDELAREQVGRDAEEAVLELLDPAVAEHLAEQLAGARAADQRVGGQRVVAARVLLDEAADEDLVQDVGRGAHRGDAAERSSPCSRPRSGRSGCPARAARRARRGGRRRARRRPRARARSSGPASRRAVALQRALEPGLAARHDLHLARLQCRDHALGHLPGGDQQLAALERRALLFEPSERGRAVGHRDGRVGLAQAEVGPRLARRGGGADEQHPVVRVLRLVEREREVVDRPVGVVADPRDRSRSARARARACRRSPAPTPRRGCRPRRSRRAGSGPAPPPRWRRAGAPRLRVSASAKSGEVRISASKSPRPSVTSHVSRTARTEAVRRPSCSSASSPSTSPRLSVRSTVSGGPSATTSSRPIAIT